MARILINRFKYSGDNHNCEIDNLGSGINLITGPNGAGKSTFADLIYYCFGGTPSLRQFSKGSEKGHPEIVLDTNNYVEIDIQVNGDEYVFRRYIGKTEIHVIQEDDIDTYAINRSKNNRHTFSDFLLDQLSISPIVIHQSFTQWVIDIRDLFRLVYHDQLTSAFKIYKEKDHGNSIVDTGEVRNVIFELWMGKRYSDYYDLINEIKKLQTKKKSFKTTLEEYENIIHALIDGKSRKNIDYLEAEKEEFVEAIEKLVSTRKQLQASRSKDDSQRYKIESITNDIESLNSKLQTLIKNEHSTDVEIAQLFQLKKDYMEEATQIKKIIKAHEELELFAPDTCPYCFNKVTREKGKCVCGNKIDEDDYQKFFYSTEEYLEILKEKKSSVNRIQKSIIEKKEERSEITEEIEGTEKKVQKKRNRLEQLLKVVEGEIDINLLDEIDNELLEKRENLTDIEKTIKLEEKYQRHNSRLQRVIEKLNEKNAQKKIFEGRMSQDINEKVSEFNEIYSDLMMTLPDCNSARIDPESYMPIINEGMYIEASANVHIRLLYFFTLLFMSLKDSSVTFPKFLLIDTPENIGVDEEPLKRSILQLNKILAKDEDGEVLEEQEFQVIMTTGESKYPEEYEPFVKRELTKESRLLKEK